MTRLERCQDCAAQIETEDVKHFCDEYQRPCEEIEKCAEWEDDPSAE